MLQWNQEPFKSATIEDEGNKSTPRTPGARSLQGFQKADALTLGFVMGVALATFSLVWLGDADLPKEPEQVTAQTESDSNRAETELVIEPLPKSRDLSDAGRAGVRNPGSLKNPPAVQVPDSPLRSSRGGP